MSKEIICQLPLLNHTFASALNARAVSNPRPNIKKPTFDEERRIRDGMNG